MWLIRFGLVLMAAFQPLVGSPLLEDELRELSSAHLSRAVASALAQGSFSSDREYFEGLVKGMQKAACGEDNPYDVWQARLDWARANYELQAQKNFALSDAFFQDLAEQDGWTAIVPEKLYCQILEEGVGASMRMPESVQVRLTAQVICSANEMPCGQLGAPSCVRCYRLQDLIPGLAYGMQGMRAGERRLVLIHPDLAYGADSAFEPGVTLRVEVTLVNFKGSQTPLLPLIPKQRPSITATEAVRAERMQLIGEADGFEAWSHLKNGDDLYCLEDVLAALDELSSNLADPDDSDLTLFSKVQCVLHARQKGLRLSRPIAPGG